MNAGEIILHLLGGAGMEYAGRARNTQQAGLQGKENELARLQEQLLQGKQFGHAESMQGNQFAQDTTMQGNQFAQDTTMQGNQFAQDASQLGKQITSAEGIASANRASTEVIESRNDSTNRYLGGLRSRATKYAADRNYEASTKSTESNERIAGKEITSREDMARNRDRLESLLGFESNGIQLASLADKLSQPAMQHLFDQHYQHMKAMSKDLGYTPEEFEKAYAKTAPSMAFSVDSGEEGDWVAAREATYNDILATDPEMQEQAQESLLYDLYVLGGARGFTQTAAYAADAYRKQNGRGIEDLVEEVRTGKKKLLDIRTERDAESGSWYSGRGMPQQWVGQASVIASPLSALDNIIKGKFGEAGQDMMTPVAMMMGYSAPDIAEAKAIAHEMGTKDWWTVLREQFGGGFSSGPGEKGTPATVDAPRGK